LNLSEITHKDPELLSGDPRIIEEAVRWLQVPVNVTVRMQVIQPGGNVSEE
jgi:hypothetical protein